MMASIATSSQQQHGPTQGKAIVADGCVKPQPPKDMPMPVLEDTTALLRFVYADLTRLSHIASDDIVLHAADRSLSPTSEPVRGIAAAQTHEENLVAATGGTIAMDVESITANANFGTVMGTLRAQSSGTGKNCDGHGPDGLGELAMPFCGVWRFVDGKAVEHWENAADPAGLMRWLDVAATGKKAGSQHGYERAIGSSASPASLPIS